MIIGVSSPLALITSRQIGSRWEDWRENSSLGDFFKIFRRFLVIIIFVSLVWHCAGDRLQITVISNRSARKPRFYHPKHKRVVTTFMVFFSFQNSFVSLEFLIPISKSGKWHGACFQNIPFSLSLSQVGLLLPTWVRGRRSLQEARGRREQQQRRRQRRNRRGQGKTSGCEKGFPEKVRNNRDRRNYRPVGCPKLRRLIAQGWRKLLTMEMPWLFKKMPNLRRAHIPKIQDQWQLFSIIVLLYNGKKFTATVAANWPEIN